MAAVRTDLVARPWSDAPPIERAAELDALEHAVGAVATGDGGVVVIEAAAGQGKTLLLDHTAELAEAAGCRVRRAAPSPLERDFPYGVVRALLEAPLREASRRSGKRLVGGALDAAAELLLDGRAPGDDGAALLAHSVLWLCNALAEQRPLVLIVDDAQWCDRASLEVLCYLARRIEDLPLLIAVGAGAGHPDAPADLLGLLAGARAATVLHPQPLSPPGAVELIRRSAPGTAYEVCRDWHRAVSGNPWLLSIAGRQLAECGATASDATGAPVAAVVRHVVRRRLAELTPRDRAVVSALAVLGREGPPHVLAPLAGIAPEELGPARDALQASGLLAPGGHRIAHALIGSAISQDLARTEQERLHRDAARLLRANHATPDAVAQHLLQCGPQADSEVSAALRDAAAEAARQGAPRTAATYLARALNERAPGDDRAQMLAALATATFDAGLADPRRRLHEALREAPDPDLRLDVLTQLATLQVVDGGDGTLPLDDEDPHPAIEVASLDALMAQPERHAERTRRLAALDGADVESRVLADAVLAHRASLATALGSEDAAACAALALEALADGELLREATRRSAYHLCVRVLVMTDRHADAARAIDALRDEAMSRGSLPLRAAAAWYDAELALRTGRVAIAENAARAAFDVADGCAGLFSGPATGVLIRALAERGAFDEARELLRERGLAGRLGARWWELDVGHARARLWLAEGDYERAYAEATAVGQPNANPAWMAWRSTAALALAHLGRRGEAAALADAELALAERFGAPAPIVAALHARAVAEPDEAARIALCRHALALADGAPARLDGVRLRLELGRTLARGGGRLEAREVMRPALAEAEAIGAAPLTERARRELVATGLRPRHAAIAGAGSLTPRQRQICALAAVGKSNRAIAQELFLSIKTIETHLAASYRKLGVSARVELATALQPSPT